MHVLPLWEGLVGGGPQGLRLADERVKLAARSAETIVDLILVIVSQLRVLQSAGFPGKLHNWDSRLTAGCSRTPSTY